MSAIKTPQKKKITAKMLLNRAGTTYHGTIKVRNQAEIGENALIGKNMLVGNDILVGKNMTVGKKMTVNEDIETKKGMIVKGDSVLHGGVSILGNASVLKKLSAMDSEVGRLKVTSNTSDANKDNGVVFKAGGPNTSHSAWGAKNDWYIRSGHVDGKVILQDKGGNVGIGTDKPIERLHVNGGIRSDTKICLGNTCITEADLIKMKNQSNHTHKIGTITTDPYEINQELK